MDVVCQDFTTTTWAASLGGGQAEGIVSGMKARSPPPREAVAGFRKATPVFVFDMARRRGPIPAAALHLQSSSSTRAASASSTIWTPPGATRELGRRWWSRPLVIVINDCGDTTLEKIAQLKNPALAWCPPFWNVPALTSVLEAVRGVCQFMTGDTVEKFARCLPPRLLRA